MNSADTATLQPPAPGAPTPTLAPPVRIPALDGLRGIAILLVLVVHYFTIVPGPAGATTYRRLQTLGSLGFTGVDLFFVLSGFLIGGILLDHRASARLLPAFYARRFFRIVPLYGALLASYFIFRAVPGLTQTNHGTYFWSPLPLWTYFGLVQNAGMAWVHDIGPYWLGATWSLSVEEQFYLLMPLVVRYLAPRHLASVCLGVILLSPFLRLHALDDAQNDLAALFLLPTRADGLMWGVLCAVIVRHDAAAAAIRRHGAWLRAIVVVFALGFIAVSPLDLGAGARPVIVYGYSLVSLGYAATLLHVVLFPEGRLARVLGFRPLAIVGVTSYFTYLFHTPIWYLLHWYFLRLPPLHYHWRAGAVTLLAVFVTFAAAWLSWRWFEGPLLRWARRFSYG